MENILGHYSTFGYEDYTIEEFYEYCMENDDEFTYTKEEFIKKFEDSQDFYDWTYDTWDWVWKDYYDDCVHEANKILKSKDYVKVTGSLGLWNGRKYVDRIITETDLGDIISTYLKPDGLEITVYEDRVELSNCHHDGTNYYEFYPFSYNDLTKKELLELVNKDSYEWYGDKLYKATKDDLVNYLNDNM